MTEGYEFIKNGKSPLTFSRLQPSTKTCISNASKAFRIKTYINNRLFLQSY